VRACDEYEDSDPDHGDFSFRATKIAPKGFDELRVIVAVFWMIF
jgi:hypothetical protein